MKKILSLVVVAVICVAFNIFQLPFVHATTSCNFTKNLYQGIRGDDVLCLQKYLNASGFVIASNGSGSSGNETNYFGPLMAKAVSNWQSANGISPASGYFGTISRAKFNELNNVVAATPTANITANPPSALYNSQVTIMLPFNDYSKVKITVGVGGISTDPKKLKGVDLPSDAIKDELSKQAIKGNYFYDPYHAKQYIKDDGKTYLGAYYAIDFAPVEVEKERDSKIEVTAASAGTIKFVNEYNDNDYGKYIIIGHQNGYYTFYAHLDHPLPNIIPGYSVKKGEEIGIMGNTGTGTGTHLHFQVLYGVKDIDDFSGLKWKEFLKSHFNIEELKKVRLYDYSFENYTLDINEVVLHQNDKDFFKLDDFLDRIENKITPTTLPVPSPTPTPNPTTPDISSSALLNNSPISTDVFTYDLYEGMRDDRVVTLQKFLKEQGFFPANVQTTDYFGLLTKAAVVKFQKANNITASGYFGAISRAKFNELNQIAVATSTPLPTVTEIENLKNEIANGLKNLNYPQDLVAQWSSSPNKTEEFRGWVIQNFSGLQFGIYESGYKEAQDLFQQALEAYKVANKAIWQNDTAKAKENLLKAQKISLAMSARIGTANSIFSSVAETAIKNIVYKEWSYGLSLLSPLIAAGTIATDFYVDYSVYGKTEAINQAVSKAITLTYDVPIFEGKVPGKKISLNDMLSKDVSHSIGSSGMYSYLNRFLEGPELKENIMKSLAATGVFTTEQLRAKATEVIINKILQATEKVLTPPLVGCTPNWQTGSWGTCSNGQQTRTVTDSNNCGTTTNKPSATQSCTVAPVVNPVLYLLPTSGPKGTKFTFAGIGFTPNRTIQEIITKPDGTQYVPNYYTANADGNRDKFYDSSTASIFGTYIIYWVDELTGKRSNTVYETISAH